MAVTKKQKQENLQQLKEMLGKATSIVFARNAGLSVKAMSEMRRKLREQNIECKMAKKTLLRLAAKDNGIDDIPDAIFEGAVITVFGYDDQTVPARIVYDAVKTSQEKLELLGGIVDKKPMDKSRVKYLATLPSREQLIAKLLGTFNAPVSRFASGLSQVTGGFVRVLNAYKEKKEKGA